MFYLRTRKVIIQSQRMNEVGFLIEVPTSFSSIEKLANKKYKKRWQYF